MRFDRELYRTEEIYTKIREDPKYNAKTVKLAFQLMTLTPGFEPQAANNIGSDYRIEKFDSNGQL